MNWRETRSFFGYFLCLTKPQPHYFSGLFVALMVFKKPFSKFSGAVCNVKLYMQLLAMALIFMFMRLYSIDLHYV